MTDLPSAQTAPTASPNRLATASLILGLLGWMLYLGQWCLDLTIGWLLALLTAGSSAICSSMLDILPFPLWLTGLVLGHVALGQIKRTGSGGRGKAVWGLLLGYAGLIVGIVLVLLLVGLLVIGVQSGWFKHLLPSHP
jgi:hypothetical protein